MHFRAVFPSRISEDFVTIDAYKNKNGTQVQYILRSWFELVVRYSTRKKECILVRLINSPIVLKLQMVIFCKRFSLHGGVEIGGKLRSPSHSLKIKARKTFPKVEML